jgi:DNA-directed RNA polymerase subunit A"
MKVNVKINKMNQISENKRKLTKSEVNSILSYIKPNVNIPEDIAKKTVESVRDHMRGQLEKIKIYPNLIGKFTKKIISSYTSTLVQPGECVGIVMAQSIGEKQTQANLNSVDWMEKVLYIQGNRVKIEHIGKMIDDILKQEEETKNIKFYQESHTEYLEIKEKKIYIPSCDENGMCNWYKIEAVTRHYPEGKLVRVKTLSGRSVTATQGKSFLVWNGEKFIVTCGSDLKIGDMLPTTSYLPMHVDDINYYNNIELENNVGFLIGVYLAKEYIKDKFLRDNIIYYCEKLLKEKIYTVPNFVYTSNTKFIIGFLEGFFSANSIIESECIKSKSQSKELLYGISFLLSYFGIFGHIVENGVEYYLIIKNDFIKIFTDTINIIGITEKNFKIFPDKTQQLLPSRNVYFDQVISIEFVDGTTQYVYDFTVESTRNFQLWNGINCRDTFHRAGSADKQPVVSKFSELLNATNKPKAPSFYIYFSHGNNTISELRNTIGHSIVQLTFKKITKSFSIHVDKEEEHWYPAFYIMNGENERGYTDCVSLKIDMDILYEYKLRLKDIADHISKEYSDLYCIFSPDCFGQLDIFLDTNNIEFPEEKLIFVTKDNSREIYLEEVVQPTLENIVLCGISGIMNIFFVEEKTSKKWFIETENSREKVIESVKFKNTKDKPTDSIKRFKKVLAHPSVDMTKTVSNNIWDIYHTLGIEATRQYMIDEFSKIMEGINICHVMLLVDKMTNKGIISSISRYTMRMEDTGVLAKSSFEETLDNLLGAGIYGQQEPTRGVSSSIICGKRARIGTGLCDVSMDMNKIVPGLETIPENDELKVCNMDRNVFKYEKSRILGLRTSQLSNGAKPEVDIEGMTDPLKIAEKEYKMGKIPINIIRPYPNGKVVKVSIK